MNGVSCVESEKGIENPLNWSCGGVMEMRMVRMGEAFEMRFRNE